MSPRRRPRIDAETAVRMCTEYRSFMSLRQVARRHRVSVECVRKVLARAGVALRSPQWRNPDEPSRVLKIRLTANQIKRLAHLGAGDAGALAARLIAKIVDEDLFRAVLDDEA